jgi:peroxiredoxin
MSTKVQAPKVRQPERTAFRPWRWLALAGIVVVVGASFVVPSLLRDDSSAAAGALVAAGTAPSFREFDVISGDLITDESLRGRNALLFFSEGVMCQACFQQIQALEAESEVLKQRGLTLINVTNDPDDYAREAVEAYEIRTPLIADEDRDMSSVYDVLGQGMHANTAGHTFILVDKTGHIRWRRDYWTGSNPTMYVPPAQLFRDIPKL